MSTGNISIKQHRNSTESITPHEPTVSGSQKKYAITLTTPRKIIDDLNHQGNFTSQAHTKCAPSIFDDSVFIDKSGYPTNNLNRSSFFIPMSQNRQQRSDSIDVNNETNEATLDKTKHASHHVRIKKVQFSPDTKDNIANEEYTKVGMNMEVIQNICTRRPLPMSHHAFSVGLGIVQDYTSENGELLVSKITDSDMKKISRIQDSDIDLFEKGLRVEMKTMPFSEITHTHDNEDLPLSRDGILLAKLRYLRKQYDQ